MSSSVAAHPMTSDTIESRQSRRIWWLALAAFLLRMLLVFAFHTYRYTPAGNNHSFAFETGSIAASLVTGHGFSSPFGEPSGPTAWIAPIYPALVALAFKIFGLYSQGAALAMFVFNSLCAAATVPVIFRIGRRVFDARSGEIAAWTWALVPFFARWPVTWIWDTALSALL